MTRDEIIAQLKEYFAVKELVCDHTFARYGESSWNFLDTDYLHVLLVLRRDILRSPMICNTKTLHQRGLRCNRCGIVSVKKTVYLSAHVLGKAGDFTVQGMTASLVRKRIKDEADKLPCQVRIEAGKSWLHIDVRPTAGRTEKVVEFYG